MAELTEKGEGEFVGWEKKVPEGVQLSPVECHLHSKLLILLTFVTEQMMCRHVIRQ